jgi:hypothetical protein
VNHSMDCFLYIISIYLVLIIIDLQYSYYIVNYCLKFTRRKLWHWNHAKLCSVTWCNSLYYAHLR